MGSERLPHSDPVLDGPVIQAADDIARRGGVRIADVIRTEREAHQVAEIGERAAGDLLAEARKNKPIMQYRRALLLTVRAPA